MNGRPAPRVAVVGGGITGLAAAHALTAGPDDVQVTLFERNDRLGGKVRTSPFAGHPAIDEGPDAFLARLPWGIGLANDVGVGDSLVAPESGRAAVWWDGLHDIPAGLLLGMPTDIGALARSRLLGWAAKLRAATEPLRRRTDLGPDSLGAFVRARFGDEVHLRLVDPLVGSIYAADTDHFSLAAVPQIAELAAAGRSVLLSARRRPATPDDAGPVFYAPRAGMGALVDATAAAFRAVGGEVRLDAAVSTLQPDGRRWRLDDEQFDGVVLACPPAASAHLLATLVPEIAGDLRAMPVADVAMLTLTTRADDWPERLIGMSGYLVPKPMQRLVTAGSFGSQKWPHWQVPGHVVLRISLGRDGLPVLHLSDEQLIAAAVEEVGHHLGLAVNPSNARVSRWPGAFPQYRPHHGPRVRALEAAMPAGLALAGAGYHGIGVPACIRSGREAAAAMARHVQAMSH